MWSSEKSECIHTRHTHTHTHTAHTHTHTHVHCTHTVLRLATWHRCTRGRTWWRDGRHEERSLGCSFYEEWRSPKYERPNGYSEQNLMSHVPDTCSIWHKLKSNSNGTCSWPVICKVFTLVWSWCLWQRTFYIDTKSFSKNLLYTLKINCRRCFHHHSIFLSGKAENVARGWQTAILKIPKPCYDLIAASSCSCSVRLSSSHHSWSEDQLWMSLTVSMNSTNLEM